MVCVLGGFMLIDGPLGVLVQPSEFIVIGGAVLGSMIAANPLKLLMLLVKKVPVALKGSPYNKAMYLELLRVQYEVFINGKKGGLLSIEEDINSPAESTIFSKYPKFLANHHGAEFFCDAMKMLVNGSAQAEELEMALEVELETHHSENGIVPGILHKVSDSLPGLGIVAAVLGIVVTMQHLDGPPQELGEHVAAALVGTFLGLLCSYGMIAPIAQNLDNLAQDEAKYLECMKAGILAFANGSAPTTSVEFARKTLFSCDRPSTSEIEPLLREIKPR
jgi:chemotaxis protein MotA